jgi:MFS family permease
MTQPRCAILPGAILAPDITLESPTVFLPDAIHMNTGSGWHSPRKPGRPANGRGSSYVGLGWQAGVLLAAWLTPLLLPVIGWRGMFAVGLLPAFVAFVIRHMLDEPEIFIKRPPERQPQARRNRRDPQVPELREAFTT